MRQHKDVLERPIGGGSPFVGPCSIRSRTGSYTLWVDNVAIARGCAGRKRVGIAELDWRARTLDGAAISV